MVPKMKWYQQRSKKDNAHAAIRNLVYMLGLPVSKLFMNQVKSYSDYPSLSALSDFLRNCGVETMGVRLELSQVGEIPLPAIAHIVLEGEEIFVVVTRIQEEIVTYIDGLKGEVAESIDQFADKWTGIALLIEPGPMAGEVGYTKSQAKEMSSGWRRSLLGGILAIFCAFDLFRVLNSGDQHFLIWTVGFALYLTGTLTCVLMITKSLFDDSSLLNKACGFGGSGQDGCQDVLNSPASRLFGLIALTDVGAVYFLGKLIFITQISTDLTLEASVWIMIATNSVAIPFTFFSIYYQLRVVKKLCTLCVLVVGLLWTEFCGLILLLPESYKANSGMAVLMIFSFLIATFCVSAIREYFVIFSRARELSAENLNFKKSYAVLKASLNDSQEVDVVRIEGEFIINKSGASTHVVVALLNPTCDTCGDAFMDIIDLSGRLSNCTFIVRFMTNTPYHARFATILLNIVQKGGVGDGIVAVTDWYGKKYTSLASWIEKYSSGAVSDLANAEAIAKQWFEWQRRFDLQTSPTFVIDTHRVPRHVAVSDFFPYLRQANET